VTLDAVFLAPHSPHKPVLTGNPNHHTFFPSYFLKCAVEPDSLGIKFVRRIVGKSGLAFGGFAPIFRDGFRL
jgi:hypothetical protein